MTRCDQTTTPDKFVARADEQLYREKSQGRNRVCLALGMDDFAKSTC
ncbi:GGDEF domain-containing protein [Desulfonatronum lacustre]|nr:GGDEF domain-containing protein [Desulfonatronum lacustre]